MILFRRVLPVFLLVSTLALAAPARALLIEKVGADGGLGEDGESAHASGSEIASGAAPAEVIATAEGGAGGAAPPEGGPAGDGGAAGLGPLYASSDTGDVLVAGTARGGNGGNGGNGASAGDGAAVRLYDSVDGDTAGALELSQDARGGNAGYLSGGRAGAALSSLQRRKAAESFQLVSRALAGGAATTSLRSLGVAEGAPARATGMGANAAGSMRTLVTARGGLGGGNVGVPGGDGGDASAVAYGLTEGDGHPVFVGILAGFGGGGPVFEFPASSRCDDTRVIACPLDPDLPPITLFPALGAIGGNGGGFLTMLPQPLSPPAGDGGNARSTSVGIAQGDSPVEVFDLAAGGSGGFQIGVESGGPSEGGSARSLALGIGGGTAPVKVEAQASGGAAGSVGLSGGPDAGGFSPSQDGLPGGKAEASAVAIGHEEASASALARGGDGTGFSPADPRHAGGAGKALARAIGGHGTASAAARSSSEALRVEARARAELPGEATSEARIGPARPWPRAFQRLSHYFGGRDVSVDAEVAPDTREVARALRRERQLDQALAEAGVETVDALGTFSAWQRSGARGALNQVSVLEVELSSLALLFLGATDPVYIGLFAPQIHERGFVSLHLSLENGEDLLVDESFDSAAAARAFLDGALLEVGPIETGPFPLPPSAQLGKALLRVELVTSRPGAGLSLDFLVGTAPPSEPF